jgi:hypothetical protein
MGSASTSAIRHCRPREIASRVYEELPGWKASICSIADFDELPAEATTFIGRSKRSWGTRERRGRGADPGAEHQPRRLLAILSVGSPQASDRRRRRSSEKNPI